MGRTILNNITRDIKSDFSPDDHGNFRAVFKLKSSGPLLRAALYTEMGSFIGNFNANNGPKALSPVTGVLDDCVYVAVGYAQKFQTEFNAEFN